MKLRFRRVTLKARLLSSSVILVLVVDRAAGQPGKSVRLSVRDDQSSGAQYWNYIDIRMTKTKI